ncbi:MOSC domain-containing protein [Planctobacterium marinum]|uniref:MOSC domain-containing protein n=1 Tax=Planctobacterium marinum TaxID=1631968 RepID=A0AA48KS47_9ALTE|nr:MOSC domain-containing protein [Planctobacterium marinum]
MQAIVSGLFIYPVKSLAGVSVKESKVTPMGLEGDRQWMIVDGNGKFVTQRQIPAMATIQTQYNEGKLVLSHPEFGEIKVKDTPHTAAQQWQIWKDTVSGFEESPEVSEWLTSVLGEFRGAQLRLVKFDNASERPVGTKYLSQQESSLKLADACPFLITCEASLEDLNKQLPTSMPMDRFRANIVLTGTSKWQEYQWKSLHSEQLNFAMIGACQRCPMTSIDQKKGIVATPGQPLQTLMEKYPVGEKNLPYFGQHAHLPNKETGKLAINDALTIEMAE